MNRIGVALLVGAALLSGADRPFAQELIDASEEDLLAREKVRSTVESVLADYLSAPGPERINVAIDGIQRLQPFAAEVVPYLASELEREAFQTFEFMAYALGALRTPEAAFALRDAIARAEASPGTGALIRKAWSCWALGLHGDVYALETVNSGTHRAAHYAIHAQTSTLETIALQTAPECVPILIEQYDRWGASENEEIRRDRRLVLRSLRRVADPQVVPKLIEILRSGDEMTLRAQAAVALRSLETPESIDALMKALKDDEEQVRRSAAFALEWMMPPGDAAPLLDALDSETETKARGALYRVVAARIEPEQHARFLEQWGRTDPQDRRMFVNALSDIENGDFSEQLYQALDDPQNSVILAAIGPLARSGKPEDQKKLLEVFNASGRPVIAEMIAQSAGKLQLKGFAPDITRRLLEVLNSSPAEQAELRPTVAKLGQALVALQYTSALSKLRRARKSAADNIVLSSVDLTIESLDSLRKNGKSVEKWTAVLEDVDANRRRLARKRLLELGGEDAVTALVEAYDTAEAVERLEMLLALADTDTPQTRALARRVLLDPEVAPSERRTAAWAARQYGDAAMFDLLAESVAQRNGRDAEMLIYAAIVGREKALPLIEEYRLSRMGIIGYTRGEEQEILDWIVRRVELGRPIDRYDREPARLGFQ